MEIFLIWCSQSKSLGEHLSFWPQFVHLLSELDPVTSKVHSDFGSKHVWHIWWASRFLTQSLLYKIQLLLNDSLVI